MRYVELDIFGVLVSPLSAMLLAAFVVYAILRHIGRWFGLWRHVWHPALASLALYVIVLSAIVIGVGR